MDVISAEAQVTAASADLGALNGQITFQELDVAFSGLNLAQQQPSTIAIASGAATIEQTQSVWIGRRDPCLAAASAWSTNAH